MGKKVIMLSGIITIILGIISIYILLSKDTIGPQIMFDEIEEIQYITDYTGEELLQNIKAIDDKDGNVTDSLIIESVKSLDTNSIKVTYVAMDKSKNVTKEKKIYLLYEEGENKEIINEEVTNDKDNVSDVLSKQIQEVEAEMLSQEAPRIFLKEEQVIIGLGEAFNRLNWIENITDDKDMREKLYQNIQINGDVNENNIGTYEIVYFVIDSDGNRSNEAILTVTVTDAA